MALQQPTAEYRTKRSKAFVLLLIRGLGLLVCVAITALFGLVPFLLGALVQTLSPKRLHQFIAGILAIAVFFALWHFTDWASFTVGHGVPVLPWGMLSLFIFIIFFVSGAALIVELLPRRFCQPPAAPILK